MDCTVAPRKVYAAPKVARCEIRSLEPGDLIKVGRMHCEAFPKDMRSRLGAEVVANYFGHQLKRRSDVHAIGAYDIRSGELLGFCFAGVQGNHASGWMMKNLSLIAPRLLIQPRLWSTIDPYKRLRSRWRSATTQKIDSSSATELVGLHFEIFSLAVKGEARNTGIGKALMREQEANALRQRCVAISLTSPLDDQNTIAFYKGIGFRQVADNEQAWTGRMVKDLV